MVKIQVDDVDEMFTEIDLIRQNGWREIKIPVSSRVESGIFGQTSKMGQPPCLFHSSVFGIKIKLTKQIMKILMRQLIRSRLIWISTVCKCMSEFT